MKLKEFLELVENSPETADYELCLSDYFTYDDDAEITVVSDFPILGIAVNEETKEVRFILKGADFSVLEKSRDKIHRLLREKL